MADPQALTRRLAVLARDIQSQDDVLHATESICRAAVEMIGQHGFAAVTLVHRAGTVETAAATSDVARRGDALQYELREGPCLDAAWHEKQVYSGDLRSESRWPTWGPRTAEELGVGSMLCTRLFTNESTLGALNLYSVELDAFTAEDQDRAQLLAAHSAVAVASAQQVETLKIAIDHRTTIGTSIGIVMERFDLDGDEAFLLLRRLSSTANRKIYDIASELVLTRRLPTG
jgi:GAF domain-containing protein